MHILRLLQKNNSSCLTPNLQWLLKIGAITRHQHENRVTFHTGLGSRGFYTSSSLGSINIKAHLHKKLLPHKPNLTSSETVTPETQPMHYTTLQVVLHITARHPQVLKYLSYCLGATPCSPLLALGTIDVTNYGSASVGTHHWRP